MLKKSRLILLLSIIFFSGCSFIDKRVEPTIQSRIEQTIAMFTQVPSNTPYATQTAYPTLTLLPTYTPRIIIVTPTATATPKYTSTITETPTNTATVTKTPDPTKMDKNPGFYLVGNEIAPGVWRSLGDSDSCYWEITTQTGNILSNHFGMAGGTMYIPTSAFQVMLDPDCGKWTYLGD
jgi:hypothetical protein